MKINELREGIILDNNALVETFLCSPQGGMRRSKRTNSLILISDQMKLYDVFHPREYTYYGRVRLSAAPYTEIQYDAEGQKRRVCMFPLEKA